MREPFITLDALAEGEPVLLHVYIHHWYMLYRPGTQHHEEPYNPHRWWHFHNGDLPMPIIAAYHRAVLPLVEAAQRELKEQANE